MRHLVIPDTQIKPDKPMDHMLWAGKYACAVKPDTIIHIGDHWDMPSLSSYDVGKKSFEGRRYSADVEAGNEAMQLFTDCIRAEQARQRKLKKRCGDLDLSLQWVTMRTASNVLLRTMPN